MDALFVIALFLLIMSGYFLPVLAGVTITLLFEQVISSFTTEKGDAW